MINQLKRVFKYMKEKSETKSRIIFSTFCVVILAFSYVILNYSDLKAVYQSQQEIALQTKKMKIVLGGEAVGIKLLASGVLVMGIDRQDTELKIGDIILKVNGHKIESNAELINDATKSGGKALTLEVSRDNQLFETSIIPHMDEISKEYKLGLWVKDSSAGVGTITFYDQLHHRFAALGHGVTETKENYILPIETGGITRTTIYGIKKGVAKNPGELKGSVTNDTIGQIQTNTEKGIYGDVTDDSLLKEKEEIEILPKTKIKEKEAFIYCTLDTNQVEKFQIQIEKVLLTSTGNKNMIIKITDPALINKTGGIVQGMSGSPIVQDGKLVGAVTHVFLNDPTRGYGVFIENMIEDMNKIGE